MTHHEPNSPEPSASDLKATERASATVTAPAEDWAGTSTARTPGARPTAHRWWLLAVIGVAQLMIVLDTTIMNIALPSAQADLGFGLTSRQWVVTAYSLAFGSLLLLGGRLSDLLGRRRTLLIGMLGFAAASALGGAAANFSVLITARALQGVFAAVLAPAALSTLNVTFPEGKERARAFGIYAAIAAGGSVVGLIVGGMLTDWLSWRWCLYVNILFAVPAAAGVLTYLDTRERRDIRIRLDWPGVLTASGGLFALVYALSNAETHSWSAPLTITLLVAAAALLAGFVLIEARVAAPLLPLRVLTDRNRGGSYVAIMIAFCAMFGAFLFLTYYLQTNLGFSPLKTGLAFLPLSAGIATAAGATTTKLLPRFGPRPLVRTGMLIAAAGMLWLAQLSTGSTYAGNVLGPMFVLGFGVGMTFAPSITTATAGIARRDAGVGSAMVNTSQQIGGAVGIAALSTIFASAVTRYATSHLPPGAHLPSGALTGASGSAQTPPGQNGAAAALIAHLRDAATIHGYTVAFTISCVLFLAGAILTALLLRSGRLTELPAETAPAS